MDSIISLRWCTADFCSLEILKNKKPLGFVQRNGEGQFIVKINESFEYLTHPEFNHVMTEAAEMYERHFRAEMIHYKDEYEKIQKKCEELKKLCGKLLNEVEIITENRADSSLPEWKREAEKLGVK